jgi:hypothetical protein
MKTKLILSTVLLVMFAACAYADTTYTYTGQPFTDSYTINELTDETGPPFITGSVTGSFTLGQPLAPNLTNYKFDMETSFFDVGDVGPTLIDAIPLQPSVVSTDSFGNITDWSFALQGSSTFFFSNGCRYHATLFFSPISFSVASSSIPGTWTTTITPEPSTVLLLGTGLLGVVARRLRQKQLA